MHKGLLITLCIHAALTISLTGIIWFSQIVHFPLYRKIKDGFGQYEKMHIRRSGYLFGPIMLLEFITGVFIFGWASGNSFSAITSINLTLLILIWVSTLLFQVTQHQKLSIRFSTKWHNILVHSNWVRTILWSARSVLMFLLFSDFP